MTNSQKIRMALIALVCGGVFANSATHIHFTAVLARNSSTMAWTYPICIDAVILISALTLVQATGVNKSARFWARFGRIFGFAATIYCNIAASQFVSVSDIIVDLIPAVALIATVEMLIHGWRGTAASRRSAKAKPGNVTPIRKSA